MVLRMNRETKKLFWGCPQYPVCQATHPYRRSDSSWKASHHQDSTTHLDACHQAGIFCRPDCTPGEATARLEARHADKNRALRPLSPDEALAAESTFATMSVSEQIATIMIRVRDWGKKSPHGVKTVTPAALRRLNSRVMPMCFREFNQGVYPSIRDLRVQ